MGKSSLARQAWQPPEDEIERVLLGLAHINAGAAFKVLKRLMRELPIFGELAGAEIHTAFVRIGVALLLQRLDISMIVSIFSSRGGWIFCRADSEAFGIGQIFFDVTLSDFLNGDSFLIRLVDKLVIDVGEILDKGNVIAAVFQVAAQRVEHADGARVADVEKL